MRSMFSSFQCLSIDLIFLTTKEPPNVNREGLTSLLFTHYSSLSFIHYYQKDTKPIHSDAIEEAFKRKVTMLSLEIVGKQNEYGQ